MSRIDSGYTTEKGSVLYYEIILKDGMENGYDVFIGDSPVPIIHQPEPFIPDRSKSYIENAIETCKSMSHPIAPPIEKFVMTKEMYNKQQSDIDFLMLMVEPTL